MMPRTHLLFLGRATGLMIQYKRKDPSEGWLAFKRMLSKAEADSAINMAEITGGTAVDEAVPHVTAAWKFMGEELFPIVSPKWSNELVFRKTEAKRATAWEETTVETATVTTRDKKTFADLVTPSDEAWVLAMCSHYAEDWLGVMDGQPKNMTRGAAKAVTPLGKDPKVFVQWHKAVSNHRTLPGRDGWVAIMDEISTGEDRRLRGNGKDGEDGFEVPIDD